MMAFVCQMAWRKVKKLNQLKPRCSKVTRGIRKAEGGVRICVCGNLQMGKDKLDRKKKKKWADIPHKNAQERPNDTFYRRPRKGRRPR